MIHISRNSQDENGIPIKPDQNWFLKANIATQQAILEAGNHVAVDNIYGDANVRAALEKLFHDKCAYCEKWIEGFDVEHFRPKGRVAERPDHPGYYWLIYSWDNLYPSCPYCNQWRKDYPRWGDLTYATTGGKGTQFPLSDENTRAKSHNKDIHKESMLLIDPCKDNPEEYLTYDLNGQIYPRLNHPKGKTTIEVFHLWRRRLRDFRKKVIDLAVTELKMIREEEINGNTQKANDMRDDMRAHILSDSFPHAGAAREVFRDPDSFGIA